MGIRSSREEGIACGGRTGRRVEMVLVEMRVGGGAQEISIGSRRMSWARVQPKELMEGGVPCEVRERGREKVSEEGVFKNNFEFMREERDEAETGTPEGTWLHVSEWSMERARAQVSRRKRSLLREWESWRSMKKPMVVKRRRRENGGSVGVKKLPKRIMG